MANALGVTASFVCGVESGAEKPYQIERETYEALAQVLQESFHGLVLLAVREGRQINISITPRTAEEVEECLKLKTELEAKFPALYPS